MLYQTNPEKDKAKLQLMDASGRLLAETYIYEPGFLRFNWHSNYELLTILQGKAQIYQNGQCTLAEEDDLILINSQEGHATLAAEPDTVILLLHIFPEIFQSLVPENSLRFSCKSDSETRFQPVFSLLRSSMAILYSQLLIPEPARNMAAHGALKLIAGLLASHFLCSVDSQETVAATQNQKKLRKVLDFTDRHFMDSVSLTSLALHVGMNASYLSTFIHAHLGITYNELLARKRLQHAVHLLNNTDLPITSIAVSSGFADSRSLNATFKKYFDITPGRYRKSLEGNGHLHWKAQFPRYLGPDDPSVARKLISFLPPAL